MSPNLVLLLVSKKNPARLGMLPYGLDSNVTKLLANLPIVSCNLVSIKNIIIIIVKEVGSVRMGESDLHRINLKNPATKYQPIWTEIREREKQ